MSHDPQRRARLLRDRAAALPPSERTAFLDAECGNDDVRRRVEALLADDVHGDTVSDTAPIPSDHHTAPRVIDNYRLISIIGEGGMGEVYLAEQERPLRRRVALKIIRLGMNSREVVARFETERQALAVMNHASIAKVYDAGATPEGRPYFVMEYVEGAPLTDYCNRERLTTPERLRLFLKVCDGVQHAHQKGIIHRDLKPSNVLVTGQGAEGAPKIIDFGVAKATAQQFGGQAVHTELGQIIGTPEYMSPEQAEMSSDAVDTRTDVYSLGVLLYELIAGVLPFQSQLMRQGGLTEMLRRIREDVPPRPSTRVPALGPDTETIAKSRRSSGRRWQSELQGDVDWITMRALEKDRSRRYGSPAELAADIRRHLADEPVLAGPPGVRYRFGKFARRYRAGVSVAVVLLVALVGFAVTMTFQAGRIARERDRANRETVRAVRAAETSERTSEFLVRLFETSDPREAKGDSVTAQEVLHRGAERVRTELADEPAVQATMLRTIGRVYTSLGLFEDARPLLEEAVELNRRHPGEEDLELASSALELASLYSWVDRDEEGEPLAREALAIREQVTDADPRAMAQSLRVLGSILQHQGRYDEAEEAHTRGLRILEAALGPDHPEIASVAHNLAIVHYFESELDEAEALYKRAIRIEAEAHGEENHRLATSLHTLAILYQDQGRIDEALELEQRSLAIRERVLGPDHYHTALSLTTLGNLYRSAGRPADAEAPIRRALAIAEPSLGPGHGEVGWMRRCLARTLVDLGRVEEAVELLETTRSLQWEQDEELGIYDRGTLGDAYRRLGRFGDAEQQFNLSLKASREAANPDSGDIALALAGLASVHRDTGRFVEAEPAYRLAIEVMGRVWGPADPDRIRALRDLALLLRRTDREGEAQQLEAEADRLIAGSQ